MFCEEAALYPFGMFFGSISQLSSSLLVCWQDVFHVALFDFSNEKKEHVFLFPSSILPFMGLEHLHCALKIISGVPEFSEEEVDVE